jgi:hypothetical protein
MCAPLTVEQLQELRDSAADPKAKVETTTTEPAAV